MATIDITPDKSNAYGVVHGYQRYGAYEALWAVVDEVKLKAGNGGTAIAAADVLQLFDIKKGDVVHGGYGKVITAGGAAGATLDLDFSGGTANGIVTALDADATAGTVSDKDDADEFVPADDTIDITVNTAALSGTTGRWLFVVRVSRGSSLFNKDLDSGYTNDPNTPPQN